MTEENTHYSLEELAGFSDQQLLETLKRSWHYDPHNPLAIIGKLKKITTDTNFFYILEELHSIYDGSALVYPLQREDIHHTVFVGAIKEYNVESGSWVKVRVTLSPENERVKRNNPFSLRVENGFVSPLNALPETINNNQYFIDGKFHVENWIVDFYLSKNNKKIQEDEARLLEQFAQEKSQVEQKIHSLSVTEQSLTSKVDKSQQELAKNMQSLENLQAEMAKQQREFSKQQTELEYKLNKLTEYVKNTASMLLDLDLISQADVDTLLGQSKASERLIGHDFKTVFDNDHKLAVGYIQAFMYKKDIMYQRSVLEDFFALVCTNDLIVLAGDSGAGKTNLVKSFAEAIGGKSVIIPVKPNWTSAEDLLGYYNPLEQKYLTTPFLDALFEAKQNPDIPYFICLDEMNLARVEYYFADFLSLLEERHCSPEISLYSDSESEHLLSEARNFLALIEDSKTKLNKSDLISFLDLMRDEQVNAKLHELCGFHEGDSLLKYHARLRKMLHSYLGTPAKLELPDNVRIIGAINVDETTHYLSPKILDRAHLMRFTSPLLTNWDEVEREIESFDLDMSLPINLKPSELGIRQPYPPFDRNDPLVNKLLYLTKEYLDRLGIEFGMRTIRQARLYQNVLAPFGASEEIIFNNIILHKVLPKMMFDGDKQLEGDLLRKDLLGSLRDYLQSELASITSNSVTSCIDELDRIIRNAASNDWIVNYWSR
ncbi:AAA family ATPase [Proteus terrae]|uniref:AAA family ATPase n=1 Tax=Proteus terrae TaxID=1574161 RepID=UPI001BA90A0C|nr:AAA family ATPase [Proteus terrae]